MPIKAILACLCFVFVACSPSDNGRTQQELLLQGRTMGTTYNIKLVVAKAGFDDQALHKEIDQALQAVNHSMSTYKPDSELSRFNQHQSAEPVTISAPLAKVMAEAIRLGELSHGKLDVTVGPLVNLWGFGPEYQLEKSPSLQQIQAAQAKVGYQHLQLNQTSLAKALPSLYVDLSTIAKGYGVDVIADLLESKGIANYLVEIGGEVRLKGRKADGELWHIAIEKPVTEERSVHQVIVPQDNAVATSGDYRNYFEVNGQRFSHIIDPDTGKPINHKLVSATIIHPSAMTADGLATALMVMGADKALAFANQEQLAAYLIIKSDNGFIEQSTAQFEQYLQ